MFNFVYNHYKNLMNQNVKKSYYQYWFQWTTTTQINELVIKKTKEMIVFKKIHLYEWSVVPSDIERFRLMSCGMVLEQKIRTKGDIVLLHLVRYPLQHIAIKHYKARSIVTEQKLSSYLFQTRSECMHLIVPSQIARIKSYFPLWMSHSFGVFPKRLGNKLF